MLQDGAKPHTANKVMEELSAIFGRKSCQTKDPNMEEKTGLLAVLICLLLTFSSGLV